MNASEQHFEHGQRMGPRFLGGLLLGVLAGAATMLLWVPQSGRQTRAQLRLKGQRLRAQTHAKTKAFSAGLAKKARGLQQRGQSRLGQLRERRYPAPKEGYMTSEVKR